MYMYNVYTYITLTCMRYINVHNYVSTYIERHPQQNTACPPIPHLILPVLVIAAQWPVDFETSSGNEVDTTLQVSFQPEQRVTRHLNQLDTTLQ